MSWDLPSQIDLLFILLQGNEGYKRRDFEIFKGPRQGRTPPTPFPPFSSCSCWGPVGGELSEDQWRELLEDVWEDEGRRRRERVISENQLPLPPVTAFPFTSAALQLALGFGGPYVWAVCRG